MGIDKEKQDILIAIGTILLLIQGAEKAIRHCMTFVFQKDSPLTIEKLEAQEKEEREKTLGYFISQLRHRAAIHPSFDVLLKTFLEDRNRFIHALSEINGFDIDSPEGRDVANKFLSRLAFEAEKVTKYFVGFILTWSRNVGISYEAKLSEDENMQLLLIEKQYGSMIDDLLWEKKEQSQQASTDQGPAKKRAVQRKKGI